MGSATGDDDDRALLYRIHATWGDADAKRHFARDLLRTIAGRGWDTPQDKQALNNLEERITTRQ